MLDSGVVLSNRYRLDERVATGGMGDVWRAHDLVLGRRVAVKVLLPALLADPTFIARFRAEARMMAALRHPGIVQVYDCGEDPDVEGGRADYLVMEYVDGEPLSRRIDAVGRLGVEETLSVVAQAAQALHAAHANGIVHRDVKPSNLLVQEDGTVVLVDFGVARSTNVTSVTSADAVPGTVLYMAPEQASGQPVSGATDIYALGAVAYCCLTGSPPSVGDNPLEVAVQHLHDEPPPLPDDVPPAVTALIDRALAKKPADRFSDAAAFAVAARTAQADPQSTTVASTASGGDSAAGTAGGDATRGDAAEAKPVRPAAGPGDVGHSGPTTLTDLPVVGVRKRALLGSRRQLVVIGGALAAVLLATTGVVAALSLDRDAPEQRRRPTPAAVPSPTSISSPTATRTYEESVPTRGPQAPLPTRATPTAVPSGSPTVTPSATPTASPMPADPSPTPSDAEPSSPPSTPETTASPDPQGTSLL